MKKINGDLTFDEMSSVMSEILNGKNNDEDIAEFLVVYQTKEKQMKNYVQCLQK